MYGTLAAVCLVALFLGSANATVRMVHADPIHIANAPYIVQLRLYNKVFCGGTVVAAQFVVTAAHCFDKYDPGFFEVVAGINTIMESGVRRRIKRFIKYNRQNLNGDVAILMLDSPLPLHPYIKYVDLCSKPVPVGAYLQVSGWGKLYTDGPGSNQLLTAEIPVMDVNECRAISRYSSPITNFMMCTRPYYKDSCQGDSGGPAIFNSELCGIVSFGAYCAGSDPGIYSNVYELREFIHKAMDSLRAA